MQTRSAVRRCGAYAFTVYRQVKDGRTPGISIREYTEEDMGGRLGVNVVANATLIPRGKESEDSKGKATCRLSVQWRMRCDCREIRMCCDICGPIESLD